MICDASTVSPVSLGTVFNSICNQWLFVTNSAVVSCTWKRIWSSAMLQILAYMYIDGRVTNQTRRSLHSQECKNAHRHFLCHVTLTSDLLVQNKWFSRDHFCVKFNDPICRGFWDIVWKTEKQKNRGENSKSYPLDRRRRDGRQLIHEHHTRSAAAERPRDALCIIWKYITLK